MAEPCPNSRPEMPSSGTTLGRHSLPNLPMAAQAMSSRQGCVMPMSSENRGRSRLHVGLNLAHTKGMQFAWL